MLWINGITGTLAANRFWYSASTGKMIDSDIKFNADYAYKTDASADAYDVQNMIPLSNFLERF